MSVGQECEEKFTDEFITKYEYNLFYDYAPCAEGLVCSKNDQSNQVVCIYRSLPFILYLLGALPLLATLANPVYASLRSWEYSLRS